MFMSGTNFASGSSGSNIFLWPLSKLFRSSAGSDVASTYSCLVDFMSGVQNKVLRAFSLLLSFSTLNTKQLSFSAEVTGEEN
jgi:hypothetical protein